MHICNIVIRYSSKNDIFLRILMYETWEYTEQDRVLRWIPKCLWLLPQKLSIWASLQQYNRTYPIWFSFTGSYHARKVLYCFALLVYCCNGCRVIQHLERCLILFWMKYMNVMSLVTSLSPLSKISSAKYVVCWEYYYLLVNGLYWCWLIKLFRKQWIRKCERKWFFPDLGYSPGICLEGLRKMMKHLSLYTWDLLNMKEVCCPLGHNIYLVESVRVQNLRFSQDWCWQFWSFRMLHCAVGNLKYLEVFKECW